MSLQAHRQEVRDIASAHRASNPRVLGSAARDDDTSEFTDGQPSRGRRTCCLHLPSHMRPSNVRADSIDESAPTIVRMFGLAGDAT